MQSLHEILTSWKEDAKINDADLGGEAIRVPVLHSKYLQAYSETSVLLKYYYIERKKLSHMLAAYYRGDLNNKEDLEKEFPNRDPWAQKILRQDISTYVEADHDYMQLQTKILKQEEKVEALKEILKSISSRGYYIKSALDYHRWISGG